MSKKTAETAVAATPIELSSEATKIVEFLDVKEIECKAFAASLELFIKENKLAILAMSYNEISVIMKKIVSSTQPFSNCLVLLQHFLKTADSLMYVYEYEKKDEKKGDGSFFEQLAKVMTGGGGNKPPTPATPPSNSSNGLN